MSMNFDVNDFEEINIIDKVFNIDYMHTGSFEYSIKIKENIELWNTNKITSPEFQNTIIKTELKRLQEVHYQETGIHGGTIVKNMTEEQTEKDKEYKRKRKMFIDEAYEKHCKSINETFVKNILKENVSALVKAVFSPPVKVDECEKKLGLTENSPFNMITYGTNSPPFVGIIFQLKNRNTICIGVQSRHPIMLPWIFEESRIETYDREINVAVYNILSDEKNYNLKRLIRGLNV